MLYFLWKYFCGNSEQSKNVFKAHDNICMCVPYTFPLSVCVCGGGGGKGSEQKMYL